MDDKLGWTLREARQDRLFLRTSATWSTKRINLFYGTMPSLSMISGGCSSDQKGEDE
jgi:hypothetical protein